MSEEMKTRGGTQVSAPSTPTPWKVVSVPHFDSGLVYTSIQPVNVDEEDMKPLAMANGEYHVCRMSHTAAPWRYDYHRANAAFIVEAVNSFEAHKALIAERDGEIERLRTELADANAWIIDATKRITEVTGGGSEFFTRHGETFRADVKACCERIRDRETRAHERWLQAAKKNKGQPDAR